MVLKNKWGLAALVILSVLSLLLVLGLIAVVATTGESRFAAFGFVVLVLMGLFVAIPGTAFAFFAGFLRNVAEGKNERTFSEFANAVNGRVLLRRVAWRGETQAVEFLHCDCLCVIDSIIKRRADRYHYFMRFTVDLPAETPLLCRIGPKQRVNLRRPRGRQRIKLGRGEFDDSLRVETNAPDFARRVLNRRVQRNILALKEYSRDIRIATFNQGQVRMCIEGDQLEIQVLGSITEPEEMFAFHQLCTELLERIMPRLFSA